MDLQSESSPTVGLQFFGKISASISHEIKNVLAVLNESAGLLEDFILMAEKGTPINNERLKTLAGTIKKQIRRADLITKNMNRFAHSVDEPLKNIDVCETLELVVSLSRRFADMRSIELDTLCTSEKVYISTNPFFLETLVFRCLDFAMTVAGEEKTVGVIAEDEEYGVIIKFIRLEGLIDLKQEIFPSQEEISLLETLDAQLEIDADAGQIIIKIQNKEQST